MGHTSKLEAFLSLHREQLVSSGVPEIFWNTLSVKLQNQVFDAGEAFQIMEIGYSEEREPHEPVYALQLLLSIQKCDPRHIYLIDHAWTFRIENAKRQLLACDSLRSRLCNILGVTETTNNEQVVEDVFNNIWKICRMYTIENAENIEDRLPVWYVMDEVGSALLHGNSPNCRVVPFYYVNTQLTYSLLFPIRDIDKDFIYVDFGEGIQDANIKAASLLPWVPQSFQDISYIPPIPDPEYYLSGHIEESLPDLSKFGNRVERNKYKVFTEYHIVKQFLTHNKFEIVKNVDEADILWYIRHFKDFASLSETPEKFVNQFPFEYVITIKDLLSLTCRKFISSESAMTESLTWLPITYNLQTEITNFVSYFQYRDSKQLDNYWIIKPYNLARSLDIHITNNLNFIVRLVSTGPKIVQKYITRPALFFRSECQGLVKFDVRYVIILESVKPLKAYVYKEFFLRFANKPFQLKNFDDYEVHFTVMNYDEHVEMKHMLCSEFIIQWQEQYPEHPWKNIEKSILKVLRNVLECSVKEKPPCGIANSPQSRAVYAADIMLEWTEDQQIQPKLLEINWCPDCKRACEYYPNFYNDIFGMLFLNETSENIVEL